MEFNYNARRAWLYQTRHAYRIRNAGISKQTRDLLVIKAMLYDVTESLCKWLDKYYIIEDSKSSRIFDASKLLHKEIDS